MSKTKFFGIPAGGKRAGWIEMEGGSGPIDPKRLPEGYPYKEQSEALYVGETTITVSDPQEPVSVDTISVENNAKYKVIFDGTAYVCTADAVNDYVGNMSFLDPTSFENTGEPFLIMTHNGSTMVFASEAGEHVFSVYTYSETIHTMAPEFLPAGVGGGVQVVTFATDDMQTFTADKTFDEIAELSKNNIPVMGKIVFNGMSGMDIWLQISTAVNMNSNADTIGFYNVGAGAGGKVSIVQVAMTKTDIVYTQAEGTLTPSES